MEFLLDPDVVFLNHGSFGACPKEVFEEYQRIQRRLESEPVRFIQRELPSLLAEARARLAEFVGAKNGEVVFVPNPTFAVNEIARSLRLGPGDEVLVTNQEYGACRNAFSFMSDRAGFSIVESPVTLPVTTAEEIADEIWAGVTDRTKLIFISHITSSTALRMPVKEICRRAAERGILTFIDGAHVPGQLDLNLTDLGADFYVAACHKWLCAPKGASFLFARSAVQSMVEPLIIGWGWGENRTFASGSDFLDYHEWLGTHDPSAYLTVPTAIAFHHENDWPSVQRRCREVAVAAVDQLAELPHVARVHPNEFFHQMALIELTNEGGSTAPVRAKAIQAALYNDHRVEVPVLAWRERVFVRVSIQVYNTAADISALETGLRTR